MAQLTIPDIEELENDFYTDEELAKNEEIIKQLEEVVMAWERHISKVIDIQQAKVSILSRLYTPGL